MKLQKCALNIIEGHEEIKEFAQTYSLEKKHVDIRIAKIFFSDPFFFPKFQCNL